MRNRVTVDKLSSLSHVLAVALAVTLSACGGGTGDASQPNRQAASKASAQVASAAEYNAVVQRIYLAYFGRPVDPSGLAYWPEQYRIAGMPVDLPGIRTAYSNNPAVRSLIDIFGKSQESYDLYPGDNSSFINAIYRNLFSRDADQAGKDYWVNLLDKGHITRANAALTLMDGALGTDRITIERKLAASASFTAGLNTAARQAAYSGNSANAIVRSLLGQVTYSTDLAMFQTKINSTIGQLAGEIPPGGDDLDSGYFAFMHGRNLSGLAAVPAKGGASFPVIETGRAEYVTIYTTTSIVNDVYSNMRMHSYVLWVDQQLMRQVLRSADGLPVLTQISNLTKAEVCKPYAPVAGGDEVDPDRSVVFFRKPGPDATCNSNDDQFVAVRASASPTSSPIVINEPLVSRRNSDGSLAGFLMRNGQLIQRVDANLENPVTLFSLEATDLRAAHFNTTSRSTYPFESGKKLYIWNLTETSPASPTLLANLSPTQTPEGMSIFSNGERFAIVRDTSSNKLEVIRFDFSSKSAFTIATLSVSPSASHEIRTSPSHVVLRDKVSGKISSVPRSGGKVITIYQPAAAPAQSAALYIAGERVWVGSRYENGVVSLSSDGTGSLMSLHNARYVGCIEKPAATSTSSDCDAMLIDVDGSLRAYDGGSGALRLTYGNLPARAQGALGFVAIGSYVATWGRGVVIHRLDYDNKELFDDQHYFIKTDRAGITDISLP